MKKITFFILLVVGMMTVKAQFAGGNGTRNDPFLIEDAEQLDFVRYYLGSSFQLNADIDLSSYIASNYGASGWKPIGNSRMPFTGRFDGIGYKITGLWINRPNEDYIGLFGVIHGVAWNLVVENEGIIGRNYVGGLAGEYYNGPTIGGQAVCCVTLGRVEGNNNVGGFVGKTSSDSASSETTVHCGSHSIVIGNENVGGFVGNNNAIIRVCYSQGRVEGNAWYPGSVGGFVGYNNPSRSNFYFPKGVISSCYCASIVDPQFNPISLVCYGGFAGTSSGLIEYSYYDKEVGGKGPDSNYIKPVGDHRGSYPGITEAYTHEMLNLMRIFPPTHSNLFYAPQDNVYPMIMCHSIPSNTPLHPFMTSYTKSGVNLKSPKIKEYISDPNTHVVYPNPTTGIVSIPGDDLNVKVYDTKGILLIETQSNTVDLSAYPSGIYIFNVNGKVEKVIKQ